MLSYYVIYYEKLKKVMQQTEKEALGIIDPYLKIPVLSLWILGISNPGAYFIPVLNPIDLFFCRKYRFVFITFS